MKQNDKEKKKNHKSKKNGHHHPLDTRKIEMVTPSPVIPNRTKKEMTLRAYFTMKNILNVTMIVYYLLALNTVALVSLCIYTLYSMIRWGLGYSNDTEIGTTTTKAVVPGIVPVITTEKTKNIESIAYLVTGVVGVFIVGIVAVATKAFIPTLIAVAAGFVVIGIAGGVARVNKTLATALIIFAFTWFFLVVVYSVAKNTVVQLKEEGEKSATQMTRDAPRNLVAGIGLLFPSKEGMKNAASGAATGMAKIPNAIKEVLVKETLNIYDYMKVMVLLFMAGILEAIGIPSLSIRANAERTQAILDKKNNKPTPVPVVLPKTSETPLTPEEIEAEKIHHASIASPDS